MKESSVKFSATIGKLKEGDWLQWSQEISMSLRAQKGWGYVDGSIPAPKANTPESIEWLAAHVLEYGHTCPSVMCQCMGTWGRMAVVYI